MLYLVFYALTRLSVFFSDHRHNYKIKYKEKPKGMFFSSQYLSHFITFVTNNLNNL